MGKGGSSKKKKNGGGGAEKSPAQSAESDDSILDAAIKQNEKAAEEAVLTTVDAALAALNKLPVFAIANNDKKPLTFKLSLGDEMMAIFYADVESAKAQLSDTKKSSPNLVCDLITVGLGTAFKLASEGKAMIVPDTAELKAAGAPEGIQPMGLELPLFVCMKIMAAPPGDGKRAVLPVYMSYSDCAKAISAAQAACPSETLEVTTLGLQSVFEQLTDPAFDKTFKFIAPEASLHHCEHYLGNGVYIRRFEDPDDAVPPLM